MRPKVYLQTTIPSYLAARPSRDLVAAHQQITRDWWESRRSEFELYESQLLSRVRKQAGWFRRYEPETPFSPTADSSCFKTFPYWRSVARY